jgi:RHS repeat-associated protein
MTAGASAPVTVGAGTGYVLRDRHSSVTALVDASTAVTNTYSYGDYGTAMGPDGRALPPSGPGLGGRTNPFQWTGASPISSMTDAVTGLLLLPARSYDPAQGRFTSRDSANLFNRYQGFATNPIVTLDPSGHFPGSDILLDVGLFIVFAIAAVVTAGAALPALAGVAAGVATTSAIVTAVGAAVTTVAAITGAVVSGVKAADDIDAAVSGKHFLSAEARSALGTVQLVAGVVGALAGVGAAFAEGAATAEAAEAAESADAWVDPRRFAVVEGESDGDASFGPPDWSIQSVGDIPPDPELGNVPPSSTSSGDSGEVPSSFEDNARSSVDSVVDGATGGPADQAPQLPKASDPIPIGQNAMRGVTGSNEMTTSDRVVLNADRGLSSSVEADDAAEELSTSLLDDAIRPIPHGAVNSALEGNPVEEADVFGIGRYNTDLISGFNADDREAFLGNYRQLSFSSSSEG